MIVHDLVDTKQLFIGETKPDYLVVYEKVIDRDARIDGRKYQEIEAGTKEVVQIFHGEKEHSLRKIDSYDIGNDYPSLEAVLTKVKETHQEIFQ
ncbi:hypothetical protein [Desertibacillus haloalkaliphilus]|uniref:hypothetical protein n=1 Tax=Desertibacillus haloalkaliphilus TaxID=1328930 RepID=UPI001C27CFF5|nr:hypothetical protein [Desertibacillus haloalkaliphilus]MBU8907835.1 hypothetical protein [Desertibacillus haloalkaliphilus]